MPTLLYPCKTDSDAMSFNQTITKLVRWWSLNNGLPLNASKGAKVAFSLRSDKAKRNIAVIIDVLWRLRLIVAWPGCAYWHSACRIHPFPSCSTSMNYTWVFDYFCWCLELLSYCVVFAEITSLTTTSLEVFVKHYFIILRKINFVTTKKHIFLISRPNLSHWAVNTCQ